MIDHWQNEEAAVFHQFDRRILLVRDPRDVLISRLLYTPYMRPAFNEDSNVDGFLEVVRAKVERPTSVDIRTLLDVFNQISGISLLDHVARLMDRTIEIYKTWDHRFMLFRYEQLIAGEDKDLAEYVGAHLPKQINVEAELRRVERTRSSGDWKHWMTKADKVFFDERYSSYYKIFGYSAEPLADEAAISRRHSIDYVTRIINEGRQTLGVPLYVPKN